LATFEKWKNKWNIGFFVMTEKVSNFWIIFNYLHSVNFGLKTAVFFVVM
jgi:hypothetical protein